MFEPKDTFNESENLIDLDGNIFDLFQDDEEDILDDNPLQNDSEKSIADILWENLKCNFTEDPLKENTIQQLHDLYKSMKDRSASIEDAANDPFMKRVFDKISDLKFLLDQKLTAKLWIQFMEFVSIVRVFFRADSVQCTV